MRVITDNAVDVGTQLLTHNQGRVAFLVTLPTLPFYFVFSWTLRISGSRFVSFTYADIEIRASKARDWTLM